MGEIEHIFGADPTCGPCNGRPTWRPKQPAPFRPPLQTGGERARGSVKKWARTLTETTYRFRFIKGFINRNKPLCPDNEEFIVFVRKNYILNLRYHVPKNVLDKSWLRPPGILENVRTTRRLLLQVTRAATGLSWCIFVPPPLARKALAKHFFAGLSYEKCRSSQFVLSSQWRLVSTEHLRIALPLVWPS